MASTGNGEKRAREREIEPNPQAIRDALSLLHAPGEVFEIRALGGKLRRPLSGYFNDHDKAARAALACVRRGAEGVYVTLNPVNRALLARADNKVIEAQRNASTADKDITRRRWLLIDLDPARPSGISSTEAEHKAALDKAGEIAAWLTRCNWPAPVLADSGNGAHLLNRVELPADDSGLTSRVLRALDAIFSDSRMKVDVTTFNPSRVTKLYGTPARKGDSTLDRPHRLSRLFEVPKDLEHVPPGRLEEVAALIAEEPQATAGAARTGGFDAGAWLARAGIEILREEPYSGGIKLILRECPFGEHRKAAKSAVFIFADGRLGFHCFSDDHAGLGWKELRAKYEPAARAATNGAGADAPADERAASFPEPAHGWPEPVGEAAFHGPAGEFVRLIEPHTEADPAGLLLQFMVAAGNWMGASPFRRAGGQAHHLNEFAVLVGESKQGRKGTAWAEVEQFFDQLDSGWMRTRKASGLTSGEGLIWHVRDPVTKRERVKQDGKQTGDYQQVETDAGVEDKRLLCVEKEFGRTLKVGGREGNTLSAMLREAWDGGVLATLSKNSPARATGAHVSLIGHITPAEINTLLDATDAANGFGNRILWCSVRRSKMLPWGGSSSTVDAQFGDLLDRVRAAGARARQIGEFSFDEDAAALWEQVYPELSGGKTGLLGAMTARSEAHVIRLACVYAALDGSQSISSVHLRAALAVWRYCERSAEFIFGDRMGNPVADQILDALLNNSAGLTRTEIRDMFGRNRTEPEIAGALGLLLKSGRATSTKEPTTGRPIERWKARLGESTSTT